MKISTTEFIDLSNKVGAAVTTAYKKGISTEKERPMPESFFEALLEYAKNADVLVDYHRSGDNTDGCNWIQIKPTRTGANAVAAVKISFEENLMEIDFIGVIKNSK